MFDVKGVSKASDSAIAALFDAVEYGNNEAFAFLADGNQQLLASRFPYKTLPRDPFKDLRREGDSIMMSDVECDTNILVYAVKCLNYYAVRALFTLYAATMAASDLLMVDVDLLKLVVHRWYARSVNTEKKRVPVLEFLYNQTNQFSVDRGGLEEVTMELFEHLRYSDDLGPSFQSKEEDEDEDENEDENENEDEDEGGLNFMSELHEVSRCTADCILFRHCLYMPPPCHGSL
jgi:hypothetical protein